MEESIQPPKLEDNYQKDLVTHSLQSIKWVSFGRVLPKIFAPITTILLLNVFVPSNYGIVGICGAFIGFIAILQGLGIDDYIIREQNLTSEKINTAFWTNLSVSIAFYFLIVLAAPLIAFLYKEKQLSNYLPVLSINLILNSVGFVPWAILRKKLEFKKLFFINFAPLIISISITLPLGYMKYGTWAIVAGSVTLTFLTNLYYIFQSKWRPKFIFDKTEIKKMMNFGKFVTFERIQEYVYFNIDIFLIGYFLGLRTLGVYTLAKSWSWLIFGMVTSPLTEILYPAFQKFSDDIEKMSHYFLEVEKRLFFVTIPILLLISGFVTKAIEVILPHRWGDAGLILAFLIVGDGISKNFSLQRDLFKLIGKPDIYPKAFVINFLFALICLPIAAKFGLISFLIVQVGNDILYVFIQYYVTKKTFGFSGSDFYQTISTTLLGSVLLLFGIIAFNLLFNYRIIELNLFTLFAALSFNVLLYFITYFLKDKISFQKYFDEGKIAFGVK